MVTLTRRHPRCSALVRDRGGNVAMTFALSMVPIAGLIGAALDYSFAADVRSFMQHRADSAALNVVAAVSPGDNSTGAALVGMVKTETAGRFEASAKNIVVTGSWLNATDFEVVATAKVDTAILSALPGMADKVAVRARSVARVSNGNNVTSELPTLAQLDPEAADYNRIYAYCFDKTKKNDANNGRTQMTAIADNAGTKYNFMMPTCSKGETISYRLYNVRNSRTNPAQWESGSADRYDYFTDTTMKNDVYSYNFEDDLEILETVICDTIDKCKPKSKGGVIPEGRERTPETAKGACSSGKYIYYGWEDRPPGRGWTDRDYDDIRVIISCPKVQSTTTRAVQLVE